MPAFLTKLCHHTAAGGPLLHQFPAAWVVDARLEPRQGRAEDLVSERRRERLRDHRLCHSAHGRRSVNGTAKCGGDGSGGEFGDGPGASGEDEDGGGGGGDADAQRAHVHPTESCEVLRRGLVESALHGAPVTHRNVETESERVDGIRRACGEEAACRRIIGHLGSTTQYPLTGASEAVGLFFSVIGSVFYRNRI